MIDVKLELECGCRSRAGYRLEFGPHGPTPCSGGLLAITTVSAPPCSEQITSECLPHSCSFILVSASVVMSSQLSRVTVGRLSASSLLDPGNVFRYKFTLWFCCLILRPKVLSPSCRLLSVLDRTCLEVPCDDLIASSIRTSITVIDESSPLNLFSSTEWRMSGLEQLSLLTLFERCGERRLDCVPVKVQEHTCPVLSSAPMSSSGFVQWHCRVTVFGQQIHWTFSGAPTESPSICRIPVCQPKYPCGGGVKVESPLVCSERASILRILRSESRVDFR